MEPQRRFWQALEEIPGLSATDLEWRHRLGSDFECVQPFLTPTDVTASSIPDVDIPYRHYRVVNHGPDDIVGIHDGGKPCTSLDKRDVLIYRFDPLKLTRTLAVAFNFTPAPEAMCDTHFAWRVGSAATTTGTHIPVHLVIPKRGADVQRAIEAIATRMDHSGVLVAPTRSHLRPASESLLRSTDGHFIALEDAIRTENGSKWDVAPEARNQLSTYLRIAGTRGDEPLSERARLVLIAMFELEAFDSDALQTTADVSTRALGRGSDANSLKSVMVELNARQLTKSKTGRGGGCWLTEAGRQRADKLRQR